MAECRTANGNQEKVERCCLETVLGAPRALVEPHWSGLKQPDGISRLHCHCRSRVCVVERKRRLGILGKNDDAFSPGRSQLAVIGWKPEVGSPRPPFLLSPGNNKSGGFRVCKYLIPIQSSEVQGDDRAIPVQLRSAKRPFVFSMLCSH